MLTVTQPPLPDTPLSQRPKYREWYFGGAEALVARRERALASLSDVQQIALQGWLKAAGKIPEVARSAWDPPMVEESLEFCRDSDDLVTRLVSEDSDRTVGSGLILNNLCLIFLGSEWGGNWLPITLQRRFPSLISRLSEEDLEDSRTRLRAVIDRLLCCGGGLRHFQPDGESVP